MFLVIWVPNDLQMKITSDAELAPRGISTRWQSAKKVSGTKNRRDKKSLFFEKKSKNLNKTKITLYQILPSSSRGKGVIKADTLAFCPSR